MIHKLPCPLHGDLELYAENVLPLKLAGLRLLRWQRSQQDIKKYELVPDFPAIQAAITIYSNPDHADICDRLLHVLQRTIRPKTK